MQGQKDIHVFEKGKETFRTGEDQRSVADMKRPAGQPGSEHMTLGWERRGKGGDRDEWEFRDALLGLHS